MTPEDKAELVGNLILIAILGAPYAVAVIREAIRKRAHHARRTEHRRRPRIVRSRAH